MADNDYFWPLAGGLAALSGIGGYMNGGLFGTQQTSGVDDAALKNAINQMMATQSRAPITVSYGPDPKGRKFKITKQYEDDTYKKVSSMAAASQATKQPAQPGAVGSMSKTISPFMLIKALQLLKNKNPNMSAQTIEGLMNEFGQSMGYQPGDVNALTHELGTALGQTSGQPMSGLPIGQQTNLMPGMGGGTDWLAASNQAAGTLSPADMSHYGNLSSASPGLAMTMAGSDPLNAMGEAAGGVGGGLAAGAGGLDAATAASAAGEMGEAAAGSGWGIGQYIPYVGAAINAGRGIAELAEGGENSLGKAFHYGGLSALNFVPYVGSFLSSAGGLIDADQWGETVEDIGTGAWDWAEQAGQWVGDSIGDVFDSIGDLFDW